MSQAAVQRTRNRRGEGERLREDLLAAAIQLVETQDSPLSLRAVAREVGVAATSVYLHFPTIDHLQAAVMELGFERLRTATAQAGQHMADPTDEMLARLKAYCHFGNDHSRLYRLMFDTGLPLNVWGDESNTPGRQTFEGMVSIVRRYLEATSSSPKEDPFRLALLLWTSLHGQVLARVARPTLPWPSIDDLVEDMATRILAIDRRGG